LVEVFVGAGGSLGFNPVRVQTSFNKCQRIFSLHAETKRDRQLNPGQKRGETGKRRGKRRGRKHENK
jgi:hypothetical protein